MQKTDARTIAHRQRDARRHRRAGRHPAAPRARRAVGRTARPNEVHGSGIFLPCSMFFIVCLFTFTSLKIHSVNFGAYFSRCEFLNLRVTFLLDNTSEFLIFVDHADEQVFCRWVSLGFFLWLRPTMIGRCLIERQNCLIGMRPILGQQMDIPWCLRFAVLPLCPVPLSAFHSTFFCLSILLLV